MVAPLACGAQLAHNLGALGVAGARREVDVMAGQCLLIRIARYVDNPVRLLSANLESDSMAKC